MESANLLILASSFPPPPQLSTHLYAENNSLVISLLYCLSLFAMEVKAPGLDYS